MGFSSQVGVLRAFRDVLEALRTQAAGPVGVAWSAADVLDRLIAHLNELERVHLPLSRPREDCAPAVAALPGGAAVLDDCSASDVLLLRGLCESQDREREMLARLLHDGLCQDLTAVLLGLQVAQEARTREEQRGHFDGLRRNCGLALAEVRFVLEELRPSVLDDFGLKRALECLIDREAPPASLAVHVEADDLEDGRLPREVEIGLYQIAREALRNAIRHAAARQVRIAVRRRPAEVELAIQDDGRGLGPQPGAARGLCAMRVRTALLGGSFRLDSMPERGVAVTVRVPLQEGDPCPRSAF